MSDEFSDYGKRLVRAFYLDAKDGADIKSLLDAPLSNATKSCIREALEMLEYETSTNAKLAQEKSNDCPDEGSTEYDGRSEGLEHQGDG